MGRIGVVALASAVVLILPSSYFQPSTILPSRILRLGLQVKW